MKENKEEIATLVKEKKAKKKNYKRIIFSVLLYIFLAIFVISLTKIGIWLIDNYRTGKEIEKIDKKAQVIEKKDNVKTEIVNPPEVEIDQFDPYWDYISMNLIDVDFTDLKQENSDTVGWIKVNGTNINYPFVQTTDNSYYLNHSFNKNKNTSGWVFMDYRNHLSEFDKNTIIYAHARLDGTMFGSLKNILTSGWLDNTNNYVVKLSTEYENTLWQVFSVYHIKTTNDYIQVTFSSDNEYLNFLNMLKDRSAFDFNTTVNNDDRILTLSSCYSDSEKVVMHAKLIKREGK